MASVQMGYLAANIHAHSSQAPERLLAETSLFLHRVETNLPESKRKMLRQVQETDPILVHQLLSERRFFAQFVGTEEPPVEELLPPGEKPPVQAYIDKYLWLVRPRLPQLAGGTTSWWLEPRPSSSNCRLRIGNPPEPML